MRPARLRRARLLATSALTAVLLGTFAPTTPGTALGPVVAITPYEVSSPIFGGLVFNPALSGRGEAAGVHDEEVFTNGWVFLDTPGPEPMNLQGAGITVSGNSCMALSVIQDIQIPAFAPSALQVVEYVFHVNDRCRNIVNREIYRTTFPYNSQNPMALSFTGRFAAIVVPTDFEGTEAVLRIDTETLAQALMPVPGGHTRYVGRLGVDISDDGNVVAATAFGFIVGTALIPFVNVAVWDVGAAGSNVVGAGTPGTSAYPSLSGDGRFVAFATNKRFSGETILGPFVYVADRATATFRRASSATEPAYQPSLTRDASQVAYAVGPPGCQYDVRTFSNLETACPGTRIDVAFGPSAGFTASVATETISLAPNGQPAGGLNVQPALSGNGRWVAWISTAGQTLMGSNDELLNGRNAFLRRRDPALTIDPLDFGTIAANTASTLAATVRNTGRTSVSLDSITATPGQFTIQGGGTCAGGALLPPGATCTVNVRFAAPNNTSTTNGSLTVAEGGYDPISAVGGLIGRSSLTPPPTTTTTTTVPTTAGPTTTVGQVPPGRTTTTTSTTAPPGQVSLTADPNPVDFGQVAVGIGSPIQTVTITNVGTGSGQMLTELGGPHPEDFFVVSNGCNELVIGPGQSCTMEIMMIPLAGGRREASLILTAGGVSGDIAMFGTGHFAPQLLSSPAAITAKGFTTVIGRGFPPDQSFDVHVDPTGLVFTVTSDAQGQFRFVLSPLSNRLTLGNYILRVDPLADVFDLVRGQLVVVLATFQPQGPGGAAFGEALIVTRGG